MKTDDMQCCSAIRLKRSAVLLGTVTVIDKHTFFFFPQDESILLELENHLNVLMESLEGPFNGGGNR